MKRGFSTTSVFPLFTVSTWARPPSSPCLIPERSPVPLCRCRNRAWASSAEPRVTLRVPGSSLSSTELILFEESKATFGWLGLKVIASVESIASL